MWVLRSRSSPSSIGGFMFPGRLVSMRGLVFGLSSPFWRLAPAVFLSLTPGVNIEGGAFATKKLHFITLFDKYRFQDAPVNVRGAPALSRQKGGRSAQPRRNCRKGLTSHAPKDAPRQGDTRRSRNLRLTFANFCIASLRGMRHPAFDAKCYPSGVEA